MRKYEKVIFVSTDDTCRSPLAEGVMRKSAKDKAIRVFSRGLVVLFPEPINPKAVTVAKQYNIILQHLMSVPFTETDLGEKNLVLTMTEKQKKSIYEKYENAINVYTINEFVGGEGDIENPCGKEMEEYIACFEKISALVSLIAEKLFLEEAQMEKEEKGEKR